MSKPVIQLPWDVMWTCGLGAIGRHLQNLQKGNEPAHKTEPEHDWQREIEGALGEGALCQHFNLFWSKGKPRHPDAGTMDCRTTHWPNGYLSIYPNDPDDRPFWLLTGINGRYTLQGWILAKEGKLDKHWRTDKRTPHWCVKQEFLHSLEEFTHELRSTEEDLL